MSDKQFIIDSNEEIRPPEREISADEQRVEFEKEGEPIAETEKVLPDERIVADELRREIEMMEVDADLREAAKKKAQEIDFMAGQDKLEHLLKIADNKGVVFAIKTAREMRDPYILDNLHDILARGGYYRKFKK